jgi:light-regulated signal transduction histidine kinase (bacteriophytochrome)
MALHHNRGAEDARTVETPGVGDIEALADENARLRARVSELEQRVEQLTKELHDTVAELESFTYSVSHDLRSPIRAMAGYATLIGEEYGDALPQGAAKYVSAMGESAIRMGRLVDDLLEFARAGRAPLERTDVEPLLLVESVLHDEALESRRRGVEIRIERLPVCRADPTMLRQVYRNLISNALKYTRKREQATIEIGCRNQAGENVYYVRDNGIGFDMRHAGQIFGVFHRLHTDAEYEGTGVGLALVQRIIQRHGGRVWAEARPDEGATFFFTIPDRSHGGAASQTSSRMPS